MFTTQTENSLENTQRVVLAWLDVSVTLLLVFFTITCRAVGIIGFSVSFLHITVIYISSPNPAWLTTARSFISGNQFIYNDAIPPFVRPRPGGTNHVIAWPLELAAKNSARRAAHDIEPNPITGINPAARTSHADRGKIS